MCPYLWRSQSDKNDYQQQELLQKKVFPIIRGTPEDNEVFPMIRGTPDDKRYSQ